jgi:competence protein ComEA
MKILLNVLCLLVSLTLLPLSSFAADVSADNASKAVVMSVNINTADAETIAANLKGIGIKKAGAIVAYRTQLGKYSSPDQLLDVKGIGAKTLNKLRDQIVL